MEYWDVHSTAFGKSPFRSGIITTSSPTLPTISVANAMVNTSIIEVLQRPVEFTQFTSWAFSQRAIDSGLVPSMGSIGDCYDNAITNRSAAGCRSSSSTVSVGTRVELANPIFEYIEILHNRQRRHSSLGMLTPIEFETRQSPTSAA